MTTFKIIFIFNFYKIQATNLNSDKNWNTSCAPASAAGWTVYLIFTNHVEEFNNSSTFKYEINIPLEELQSKDLRLKYIKANNKNPGVTIDFLKVSTNEIFTMTFNNKYMSMLIKIIMNILILHYVHLY